MIYFVVQARAYLWPTMGLAGWLLLLLHSLQHLAHKKREPPTLCTEERKRREEERRKYAVELQKLQYFHEKLIFLISYVLKTFDLHNLTGRMVQYRCLGARGVEPLSFEIPHFKIKLGKIWSHLQRWLLAPR
jgi:hypothetical protein